VQVFVTGATGFLGSHLTELLVAEGHRVRALAQRNSRTDWLERLGVQFVHGDLADQDILRDGVKGCEIVFHCAAIQGRWGARASYIEANTTGTRNLLDASVAAGVRRFVHTSTVGVLGEDNLLDADESTPYAPMNPYQESKVIAEKLALSYQASDQLEVAIVRPGWMHGERDGQSIGRLVAALQSGRIALIDGGRAIGSFTYVGHTARALYLASARAEAIGQIYHITNGARTTNKEFFDTLAGLLGAPLPRWSIPYPLAYTAAIAMESAALALRTSEPPLLTRFRVKSFGRHHHFGIAKARRQLGYAPEVNLREGLRRAVEWWKTNA
jgi:nucleoside-diphosphate-sugar epimerase